MNLLYCNADGIVVAIHDDAAAAVSMAAYSALGVVRIIPYGASMLTLDRVGDPPPPVGRPPPNDTRPYRQPDATKDILKKYAGQVRFNIANGGFTFAAASGDVPVWTDGDRFARITGLSLYADSVPNGTAISFTQGSSVYELTADECKSLFNEFYGLVQQARNAEAACLDDLDKVSPTILTYDDVDEKFESAGLL